MIHAHIIARGNSKSLEALDGTVIPRDKAFPLMVSTDHMKTLFRTNTRPEICPDCQEALERERQAAREKAEAEAKRKREAEESMQRREELFRKEGEIFEALTGEPYHSEDVLFAIAKAMRRGEAIEPYLEACLAVDNLHLQSLGRTEWSYDE